MPSTPETRLTPDAYLRHLRAASRRFTEVLAVTDPAARVPTCPDWDAADLLWHLGEVQWFWSEIISDRPAGPEGQQKPDRPGTYPELLTFAEDSSAGLAAVLAGADPAEEAWSWAPDRTVGFTFRRQAHEALIHRVDAELTAGREPTPLAPALAADGVDEALDVMFGEQPSWGTFTPYGRTVRVDLADTGTHTWVELGRFTGTAPSGESYDDPDLRVIAAVDAEPDAVITGPAGDVDLWLWGRGDTGGIELSGDGPVLKEFRRVVAQPID